MDGKLPLCGVAHKSRVGVIVSAARKGSYSMIQSVDRALRILTVLQGARRMSLGEIAAALELPPSTVHGIVRTLLAHGMVQQERDSGRYRLGPATLRLGNVYLDTLELRARVAGWAEDLARRTGFAVRTGVLLLHDVVVVHHEPRPDGSRQMPEVCGEVLGPAGKRRSMTGETLTDPAALRAQLETVRATGIATEVEEAVLGECSAAAPLVDNTGEVTGAIGLVVPATEWPVAPPGLDALRAAARAVSRELGAPNWPPRV